MLFAIQIFLQLQIQDFSEVVANPRGECTNLIVGKHFAKNCMEMEEFGPRGSMLP